jgi:hypothetical protein
MKHKMTIITDKNGKFLGAVRSGTIQEGENELYFHPLPHPSHMHHEVEVDEGLMRKPFEEVREMLLSKISGKR